MSDLIARLRDESWLGRREPLSQTELQVWHLTCCEAAVRIKDLEDQLGTLKGAKTL